MRTLRRIAGEAHVLGERHPRHVLLGLFAFGVALGPGPPAVAGVVVLAVAAAAATTTARDRQAPAAAAAAVALLVGTLAGHARVGALERTTLGPDIGHVVRADATLLEGPRASPFGASALARLRGEPVLLRLRASAPLNLATGDVVRLAGVLRPAGDYARGRHAHAEVRVLDARPGARRGGVAGVVDGVRRRAQAALDHGLPAPEAGLLRGMVLGEDGALPVSTRDALRAAGLGHLVAASGQNVALLAALAAAVGAVAGIPWRARLLGMLGLVVLYVPLAGAGPSIQRAGVMGGATLVAALAGRPASRWWALGLAAATTLLLDPRAVGDPGWQLSFAAVLGLLLVAPRWREALRERGIARPLAEALAVTAAATAATAPIAAVTFGELSLVSLPANVLAAPAVAPVMWLGMLAVAVGQVAPALAAPPVLLAGLPLGFLVLVGDAAAAVPHAVLRAGPAELAAGAVALLLAVVAVRRRRRVGWRRAAPLAGAAAAVVLVTLIVVRARAPQPLPPPERLRITFLDVGQGDATLVQDRRASVLVDTGPPDADVVGQLRRAGARRLDLLVVTHAEADHEGGAAAVLAAVPVGLVLDGRDGNPSALGDQFAAVARSRGVRLVAAHAGQDLRVGSLRLRVVSPQAEPPERHAGGRTNDRAVVLDVRAAGRRVLLPADVESDVLSALPLAPVDVLKVSHHGSVDEGLPGLLERLRPRVAGIEVGRHNTYGHPAAPTLDALGSVPVVVRTDRDGAVRVDLHGDRWVVQKVGR